MLNIQYFVDQAEPEMLGHNALLSDDWLDHDAVVKLPLGGIATRKATISWQIKMEENLWEKAKTGMKVVVFIHCGQTQTNYHQAVALAKKRSVITRLTTWNAKTTSHPKALCAPAKRSSPKVALYQIHRQKKGCNRGLLSSESPFG